MTDSDDGINEHSIFDLDHAPPPPAPKHRGVGRTMSPPQAKRGSYTLSPLKHHKEKIAGRSRLWSTDSAPAAPTIKSIWSDNIMDPSARSGSMMGTGGDSKTKPPPLPSFLERRNSSMNSEELNFRERRYSEIPKSGSFRMSPTMDNNRSGYNRRPSLKEFVLRSLSPQQPSNRKQQQQQQHHHHEAPPISDVEDGDEDDTSIYHLDAPLSELPDVPFDRSSGSLDAAHLDDRAGAAAAAGEESISSLFSDDKDLHLPSNTPRRLSSHRRKVSFGSNSFHDTAESSRMAWSPELSDAPQEGDAPSSAASSSSTPTASSEVDYEYGEAAVDTMEDGIGLSSSRSSDFHACMGRHRTESQNSTGNWSHAPSDYSDSKYNDETEFDPDDELTHHQAMNARPPVVIAGFTLPRWVPPLPAINDISVKVVTYCFCGCFCGKSLRQLTDRSILGRLNVLIAILSVFPLCASAFLAFTLYLPMVGLNRQILDQADSPLSDGPNFSISETLWNMNGRMLLTGFFSFISGCASVFTWRVVRDVDLLGAIRYLWVLVWILPMIVFCVVSLFDRCNTTAVWVQHFWRSPQMAWYRKRNCFPSVSYDTLCTVPQTVNETQWCIDNYNSTACAMIRDNAQQRTIVSLHYFYGFTAVWNLLQVVILLLAIHTLENIISKPLVQKSREANVPGWLSLPCLGCLALGGFLTFARESSLSTEVTNKESIAWLIGPMYIATGGCFVVAAILGWYISNVSILSTMDKRRKLLAVYLFTADMVLLVLLLLGIFGVSIGYIVNLATNPVSDQVRGDFACSANYLGECTGCDQTSKRCMEWSTKDVTAILQTQAKASATVAAIFVCYCFSSIRFGFVMMKRISMYQIAYV